MDIVIGMPWCVKVEHMTNALDVQPARRDVRRHEQIDIAVFERFQLLLTRRLVDVAVNFAGAQAMALQAGVQFADRRLAVTEDDRV